MRNDTLTTMTRSELEASARGRGYTHVRTYGGTVALEDWTPYGIGGVNGPENPTRPLRFSWISEDSAVDGADRPDPAPFVNGVWTFCRVSVQVSLT